MSKYNFDSENDFGGTIRIGDINEEVNKRAKDAGSQNSGYHRAPDYTRQLNEMERLRDHTKNSGYDDDDYSRSGQARRKTGKRKRKGGSIGLIILALAVCALVFAGVFYAVLSIVGGSDVGKNNAQEPSGGTSIIPSSGSGEIYALVKNANTSMEISYYDITNQKDDYVKVTNEIKITDSEGNALEYDKIKIGNIVKISFADDSKTAVSISYSKDIWEKSKISDFKIDAGMKTLSHGSDIYTYTDNTIFQYAGRIIDVTKIDGADTITAYGYGNSIWSVEVNSYHGELVFKNYSEIVEMKISLDGKEAVSLDGKDRISASSGAHSVTVTGQNIENYIVAVYVPSGEDYEIDMGLVQPKGGTVEIKADMSDYKVYINGEEKTLTNNKIALPYGEYDISVRKEGYGEWGETVTVGESPVTLDIKFVSVGMATITVSPKNAYIYIDDKYAGMAPLMAEMTYGRHTITARSSGYKENTINVVVDGVDELFTITLEKESN